MIRRIAPFLSCLLLAVHVASAATTLRTAQGATPELAYDLVLGAGERLLAYSWDGGPEIPYVTRDPAVRLEFGEAGARATTHLYLPFNTDARLEAFLTRSRLLGATGQSSGDGRFGRGTKLGAATRLAFGLYRADPATGWTVSLWFRPDARALGKKILEVPGLLALSLLPDGRVEARLPSSALASSASVRVGQWNHAALSFDAALLGAVRMVLNGSWRGLELPQDEPLRALDQIVLGGGFEGSINEVHVEARAASTAQMIESGAREPAPGFHRLTLRMQDGWKTVDLWVSPATDPVIDASDELARGNLEGACVENGVLRWAPGRWERVRTANAPAARTTHPSVHLGDHQVFVFGGETRDTHFRAWRNTSDTWILDTVARTWTEIASPLAPSPRCHVPAAYSADHGLVLLAGGLQNDTTPWQTAADTWVFDVAGRRWEERQPSGFAIGPSSDHVLVYLPALRRFLLLRARYSLLYDPLADRWEQRGEVRTLTESGAPSDYRVWGSTLGALDTTRNVVVLFGGERWVNGVQSFVDTTAIHDPATNTTTVLDPRPGPSARVRSGFAYDPRRERFVLFGGVREQFTPREGDLWTFETATRAWKLQAASSSPGPRGGFFGMAYDPDEDRFFLPCGRQSGERFLDETWSLALDDHADGYALYAFDRAGFPAAAAWFADVVAPGSASVSFRFRVAVDGIEWGPWTAAPTRLGGARFVQVALILHPGASGEVPLVRAFGFR